MEFTELIDRVREIIFGSLFDPGAPSPPIRTNPAWFRLNLFSPKILKLDINSSSEVIPA